MINKEIDLTKEFDDLETGLRELERNNRPDEAKQKLMKDFYWKLFYSGKVKIVHFPLNVHAEGKRNIIFDKIRETGRSLIRMLEKWSFDKEVFVFKLCRTKEEIKNELEKTLEVIERYIGSMQDDYCEVLELLNYLDS